jgi:autotransporter-associated beta strand protein
MMHRTNKHSLIVAACAAALLSGEARLARAAVTSPFVNVQVLASTSKNGPYTSALSGLSANTTIYFEVTDILAPTGTSNSTGGAGTITFESPASDGLNKMAYNLTETGGAAFNTAVGGIILATPSTTPAANVDFTKGTGEKPYSSITATTLTDGLPAAAATPNTYDGAIASGPADVAEIGNMTFTANASIAGTFNSSGVLEINGGTKAIAASTTFFSYGNPLLLSTASTLVWSGQTSASWTDTNNFSGSTFTNATGVNATPVSFGDLAADGVTAVQNNNAPLTIPTGGVTPFSVTFSNNSSTYTFTAADANGIAGTTPVTVNGSGTVNFNSANTYSGATTINSGTLRANNGTTGSATGKSNITVAGGTLGGNGTITGTVFVSSGKITAGVDSNHAGTLNTSDETWSSGITDTVKFNDLGSGGTGTAGTNWDLINMGELNVPSSPSSPITIQLISAGNFNAGTAAANFGNGVYKIATVTSTDIPNVVANSTTPVILTGTNGVDNTVFALNSSAFANDSTASSDGNAFLEFIGTGSGTAGSLDLVFATTPEPGTAVLVLGAIAPMLLGRRRRNLGSAEATA